MAVYCAVNLYRKNGDLAPVIYNVDENGYLAGVYRSWQKPDGYSASGNLDADIQECRAELARLAQAGHEV